MDSQPYRDNIYGQLGNVLAGNSTQGVFTTGSFAFSEAEIKQIVENWKALAESYDKSINGAWQVTSIEGPGHDFASLAFANVANQSGESLLTYLQKNRDYCAEQAELSQKALDDYLGVEHTNATEFDKTDPQGPPPVF